MPDGIHPSKRRRIQEVGFGLHRDLIELVLGNQDLLGLVLRFTLVRVEDVPAVALVSKFFNTTVKNANSKVLRHLSLARPRLRTVGILRQARFGYSTIGRIELFLHKSAVMASFYTQQLVLFPHLRRISLAQSIAVTNINPLGCLQLLERVNLKGCSAIPTGGFGCLSNSTAMQELVVSNTMIGDADVETLANSLIALKKLQLAACPMITALGWHYLTALTRMESLDVSDGKIDAEGLSAITNSLTSLRSLGIGGMEIASNKFECILKLPALQSLDVSLTRIGDKMLKMLSTSQTSLHSLNLDWCSSVEPEGFLYLSSLSLLRHLSLSCTKITAAGIAALAKSMVGLTSLDLSYTVGNITLESLAPLARLEKLNLAGNYIVHGETGRKTLLKMFPDAEETNLLY